MILRPATLDDVTRLAHLGRTSFCAAFEDLYKPADLAAFLEQAYCDAVISAEIEAAEYIHQLAFDGDDLIGFCKLRYPSWYDAHSDAPNPISLAQLYTAPGRTGQGIGAKLMEWAIDYARRQKHGAIQLSVYSENFGAQRFYERYGFSKIADITFTVGKQIDAEFLYELRFKGRENG